MNRMRFPFGGMKLVRRKTAFLVGLAICAIVYWAGAMAWAQVPGGGPRAPGGQRTPGGNHAPRNQATDTETPEPAEAEEGPPEEKYDSLPVDTGLKRLDSKIRTSLREGKFADPQAKSDFDNFYNGFFLSRWTVQENIRHLHRYRQDLSSHLRTAIPGPPRDSLISLVLEFMKKLVVGHFHPAVKVNAMLAIGELNSVEASGRIPAVPLPEALDVLVKAADSKLSEGIRVAAMVGILRHAAARIPNSDAQKRVNDLMFSLVSADVPAGSTLSGQTWMVAQAAETLGALGVVGENNDVFTALLKLVANDKLPFPVRCTAADAMGRLDYSSVNGINPVEAAAALGRLAADACKDGLAKAKDTTRLPFRRRMLCRLGAVQLAISGDGDEDKNHKGILSLAKEQPQKDFVAGLQKALKEAIDALDYKKDPRLDPQKEPDVKLEDMKPTVSKLQTTLEQLLQKKP
jgi:hypothetical protein